MQPQSNISMNRRIFWLLIKQMRPKQWTKNLLIFAAPLFSFEVVTTADVFYTFSGFLFLCFISGCVYIVNDYIDIESDQNHPVKRKRPMASGELNPGIALVFGALILILSLSLAYVLNPLFSLLLVFYFCINVAYSLRLKNVVIIDIMIIAAGFVLRAIAGGLVIHVPFTPWFLLCTMLLSLFLAIGKRRHELFLLGNEKATHRKVLENYSFELLDQLSSIVTTATIISYSLFTFTSGRTIQLMWTIPLVIYGVFRYLYLIHIENKGGAPDKVLFEDKHILITVVLYVVSVILILYYFE